ncbi:MAG: hypothetical protein P4L69_05480 [Desulfosporosinus sp.]|nr:hypothetical protein [Desulfosporosinus sp.]
MNIICIAKAELLFASAAWFLWALRLFANSGIPIVAVNQVLIDWNILYDGGTFRLSEPFGFALVDPIWRLPCRAGSAGSCNCVTGERLYLLYMFNMGTALEYEEGMAFDLYTENKGHFEELDRQFRFKKLSFSRTKIIFVSPELQAITVALSNYFFLFILYNGYIAIPKQHHTLIYWLYKLGQSFYISLMIRILFHFFDYTTLYTEAYELAAITLYITYSLRHKKP